MMQFPPAETVIRAITAAQLQSPRLSDGENLFSALLKLISLRIIRKKGGELSWLPHPNKSGKTKLDSDQLVRQDTTEPSRALKVSLIQLDTGGGIWLCALVLKGKEGASLSRFIYFDTKQPGQGPSKAPALPVTRGRKSSVEVTGV